MRKKAKNYVAGALGVALSSGASAALIDRGNGLIYDSDQDLTWLQDANYAQTSGYDTDGKMTWNAATTWAENLSFGGYDDWRLPTITDIGNDGCNFSYSGTDCGFNIDTSGSELGYMWYEILGNVASFDTSGNAQAGYSESTAADGVAIQNLQSSTYWSGTEYAPSTFDAFVFEVDIGYQYNFNKSFEFFAWAVRSGDVAVLSVPEPDTMVLLAAGLATVAGAALRKNNHRI